VQVAAAGALSLDERKGCSEEPEGVEALDRLRSRPLHTPVDIMQAGLLLQVQVCGSSVCVCVCVCI
jgi:hypothetical protein